MKQSLSQGTAYLTASTILFVITNYLLHIGLARLLGVEEYGVFGVVMSLYLINTSFLNSGLPDAVSKFMSASPGQAAIIFKISLRLQFIISVLFGLIYVFFAPLLSSLLGDSNLTNLIRFLGFINIPVALQALYSSGYMNGLRQFREQAIIKTVFPILRLIFMFLFAFLGLHVFGALLGTLVATLLGIFLSVWLLKIPPSPSIQESTPWSRKLLFFSAPLVITSLAMTFLRNINILFIKSFLGDNTVVGLYTAALTLSNLPYLVFLSLPTALFPTISRSVSAGNEYLTKKYIQQSLRYMLLLTVPVTALLSATSRVVLQLSYSSLFLSAASTLAILVVSSAFLSFYATLFSIISGSGKPKIIMFITLFFVIIMLLLNLYFIPSFGILGAAFSQLLTSIFAAVWASLYVYKHFKVLLSFKSTVKIMISGIFVYILTRYWHYSGIYLLVTYIFMMSFYVIILYLFGELTKADWDLILKFFKKDG